MPQFRISKRGSARAAHTSQPSRLGEPSVIESPSAATTITSPARVGSARDLLRLTFELAHDVVAGALLDNFLDVRRLVPRGNREGVRVRSQLLVVLAGEADALGATRITALADEVEGLGRMERVR